MLLTSVGGNVQQAESKPLQQYISGLNSEMIIKNFRQMAGLARLVSSSPSVHLKDDVNLLTTDLHKEAVGQALGDNPNVVRLNATYRRYTATDLNTDCPTTYQTRQFFNNSNTNDDISTRFEQECIRCVRNEEECVCSVCL
jgi:hypothetical protein